MHDLHDLGVGPVQRVIQVGQFLQVRTTNIHTEVTSMSGQDNKHTHRGHKYASACLFILLCVFVGVCAHLKVSSLFVDGDNESVDVRD